MEFSAMWKYLRDLFYLSMAGMGGMCNLKMPENDAYFCLKATICSKKSVTCFWRVTVSGKCWLIKLLQNLEFMAHTY